MKFPCFLATTCLLSLSSFAQTTDSSTHYIQYENTRDTIGVFYLTEQEANYPGGINAWTRFLQKNLDIFKVVVDMQRKKIKQQTAVVQFVVCVDGTICEVNVINDVLPSVRKEAERVVKKSGNWVPAKQGNREVKSIRKQSITFVNGNGF